MITPGSWWVNRKTRQKLAVANLSAMLTETDFEGPRRRRKIRHGLGRSEDRYPCYLQGQELFLAWLTEDELHGGWEHLRVKPDDGVIPMWIRKPTHNDFLLSSKIVTGNGEPLWVSVQQIRSGWLCLSGIVEDQLYALHATSKDGVEKAPIIGRFNWGIQRYNTFFLPASEAVPRMRPKYDRIRTTVYDHIAQGGALDDDPV